MKKLLVTGSSGLIGSRWNQERLTSSIKNFHHHEIDIRDRENIIALIATIKPDAIVHAAAQPSHDR